MASRMRICAHGHHTVTMKTSNSVVEDTIILHITTISYTVGVIYSADIKFGDLAANAD